MKYFLISISLAVLLLSSCKQETATKEDSKPLNIILLIGDGMGVSQLSAAYYFMDNEPVFSRFPHIGLMNTSSASHRITDSGAGGTALSTGVRTYNGAISVGTDSAALDIITTLLAKQGYRNGLVVSCAITHATPAVFFANAKSRNMHEEIAAQLPGSPIHFFAGGGLQYFTRRSDGRNLYREMQGAGFVLDSVALTFHGTVNQEKRYGFLLANEHPQKAHEGRGNMLPDGTRMAIEYLSVSDQPFFLMVEGSQIDWAGHNNDTAYMRAEMIDFERAVAVALAFAEKHGNTLVIVTADHETGGYTLSADGEYKEDKGDYNKIAPAFATPGHSAALVPVLTYGPHAETFGGIYNNTDLFAKMMKAAGK